MTNTFLEFYFSCYDLEEGGLKLVFVVVNFLAIFKMFLLGARQNIRKVTERHRGITADLYLNKEN